MTACRQFLATQKPQVIADRIRDNQNRCSRSGLPSILAYHLPPARSEAAAEIAIYLFPRLMDTDGCTKALRELSYTGVLGGIKAYLAQMENRPYGANLGSQSSTTDAGLWDELPHSAVPPEEPHDKPAAWELSSSLKVLRHLHTNDAVSEDAACQDIIATIETLLSLGNRGEAQRRLDMPINNAAQTLTDPVPAERQAIQREDDLRCLEDGPAVVVQNGYEPTVRGGSRMLGGLTEPPEGVSLDQQHSYTSLKTEELPDSIGVSKTGAADDDAALITKPEKSSWV
ncbi:MAG: hypothetical protein Q9218_002743 [Villophora microphyllina]